MQFRRILLAQSGLLALAAGAVACGSSGQSTKQAAAAWSCTSDEVPMGEVVRCTQSALTMDGPPVDGTLESCVGSVDNPEVCPAQPVGDVYDCTAGQANCPPETATGGAGGSAVETSDGTKDSS